jgi:hypothetical protein
MKRMLLAAGASATLLALAPGAADAHKSRSACRHHHAHHGCTLRSAHRSRVLRFGSPAAAVAPTGASTPATPTSPQETAGTVASFKEGVLVIKLTDGSTVSGKVTESTELRCTSAAPAGEGSDDDQGEDSGDDGGSSHVMSTRGDDMSGGHGDDDGGDDDGGAPSSGACTTEALTEGTLVAEAELKVGPGGAVWEQVELVK